MIGVEASKGKLNQVLTDLIRRCLFRISLPLLTAVNGFAAVVPYHSRPPRDAPKTYPVAALSRRTKPLLVRYRMGADEEVFRLTGYLYTDAPCSTSPTSAITLPGRRTKITTAQKTVTAASHQQSVENAVW